jgi:lipoprotein-releasing system permease protein
VTRTPLAAGLTIGVATLLVALGAMAAMERDLRDKILEFNPHVTVTTIGGPLHDWREALRQVRAVEGVVAAGPVIYGQATVARGHGMSGVIVRAIDPSAGEVVHFGRHMLQGSLDALARPQQITAPPAEGGGRVELGALIVGKELARRLDATVGDTVNVISPLGTPGPAGMVPRVERFVVGGVFESGMYDYDATLAYMALGDAQALFDLHDDVSALDVRVADASAASTIARKLERALGGVPYRAHDWTETNRSPLLKLQDAILSHLRPERLA